MANLKSPICRVVQSVKVSPFRQYRITVRIKTKDFHGTPEIKVLANDHGLNFNDLDVKPTQDWGTFTTVFNSLDNNEANIYFGCWNGGAGTLWYTDPHLEEVGLLNVLRRPAAPLKVTKEQGGEKTAAVEGRDFEKIVDPHMGNIPYAGNYDLSHEPPSIRTKLPEGTRLRVSYYHPMVIYGGSVIMAPRNRKRWHSCATPPSGCTKPSGRRPTSWSTTKCGCSIGTRPTGAASRRRPAVG